jgi:hypothetical protein
MGKLLPDFPEQLRADLGDDSWLLPGEWHYIVDDAVDEFRAHANRSLARTALRRDLVTRKTRLEHMAQVCRVPLDAIVELVTVNRFVQPWYLYDAPSGLGGTPLASYETGVPYGVIPCSTMTNHGVAWWQHGGQRVVAIVTSPKPGALWDADSDIGHESAHATFGNIPLFTQALHVDAEQTYLQDSRSAPGCQALARACYALVETAVICVRGELRDTDTGLPVLADREEVQRLLDLAQALFPSLGFGRLASAWARRREPMSVEEDFCYELGFACLQVARAVGRHVAHESAPTREALVSWMREADNQQ